MKYPKPVRVPEKGDFETLTGVLGQVPAMQLPQEQLLIYALITSLRPEHVLEIGTAHGGLAAIICAALEHNGTGQLTMIDPEPTITPNTWERLGNRAHLITAYSPQGLPSVEGDLRFDFVFVDGDHSVEGVARDLEGVLPLLNAPAYILFHDAHIPDVRAGIFKVLNQGDSPLIDAGMISRCASADWEQPDLNWGGLWLLYYEGVDLD